MTMETINLKPFLYYEFHRLGSKRSEVDHTTLMKIG